MESIKLDNDTFLSVDEASKAILNKDLNITSYEPIYQVTNFKLNERNKMEKIHAFNLTREQALKLFENLGVALT